MSSRWPQADATSSCLHVTDAVLSVITNTIHNTLADLITTSPRAHPLTSSKVHD